MAGGADQQTALLSNNWGLLLLEWKLYAANIARIYSLPLIFIEAPTYAISRFDKSIKSFLGLTILSRNDLFGNHSINDNRK
jgi:hypothetical protein